jgi:hypothetical protein
MNKRVKLEKESDERNPAERTEQTTYTLNGILYVPHYLNADVFVGPGYKKDGVAYSAFALVQRGALKGSAYLWSRGTFAQVKNVVGAV